MTDLPRPDSNKAAARIQTHARVTPLLRSKTLSERTGAEVWLKLENLQETGSFKLRGAANKLSTLSTADAARGVVTASNGNHAMGLATMGKRLGIKAEIYVSDTIDLPRQQRIESRGAKVVKVPGDCLLAEKTARQVAAESDRLYISPYNDVEIIAGQGTVAVEILEKLPHVDAVFVATGGGGLICGIGSHLRSASPATKVVGCWPEHATGLYESMRAGRIVEVVEKPTLSSGTAGGPEEGSITLPLAQQVIDTCVLVSEDEILSSIRQFYRDENQVIEGAAGVAIAGFLKIAADFVGKIVVIVICGGNVAPDVEKLIKA